MYFCSYLHTYTKKKHQGCRHSNDRQILIPSSQATWLYITIHVFGIFKKKMDLVQKKLTRSRIYIDIFRTRDIGTHLLTHLHTDHARIPKTFRSEIWSTTPELVHELHPQVKTRLLVPGQWYWTYNGVPYRVLRTDHAPWSCGFYFPTLHILHLGDGQMTKQLCASVPCHYNQVAPLYILYDGLLQDYPLPVTNVPCDVLCYALWHFRTVRCVHYGILATLQQCVPSLTFRLDTTVGPTVCAAAHALKMVDDSSLFLLVGSSSSNNSTTRVELVPSTMWFYRRSKLGLHVDPSRIYQDGRLRRVFVNGHATQAQVEQWKQRFATPSYVLLPAVTRPAF